jgi:hypothetical protein
MWRNERLLRVKINVSITKNAFKITNLEAVKACEVIMDAKIKVRVKDLLNILVDVKFNSYKIFHSTITTYLHFTYSLFLF